MVASDYKHVGLSECEVIAYYVYHCDVFFHIQHRSGD